jgi:hypothetical protein
MEMQEIAKRSGVNFIIFALCAFVLWLWAAVIDQMAQLLHLSTVGRLVSVATSIGDSATLQAIVSIWLLTAAAAIAFPRLWKPLSTTTTLMFDIGYGVLGALAGFGLAIGLFGGGWHVLGWALIYSVTIAIGYVVVRKLLPLSEMQAYGKGRWILAGFLFLASPLILIWG